MPMPHNITEEVLGLDHADYGSLSRWQIAAFALEVLQAIEVPQRGQERRLVLLAREAVDDLRNYYG